MSKIGVIDCNNFFVSCERVFRPDLKNKPVVVLSRNDGCVVARSQEIKDRGISMGVPHFRIKDILKDIDATVFSSNFALYQDISRRVFKVVKSEFPIYESYSIDECFILLNEEDIPRLRKLKYRIQREVGIPVSVGVAESKTQAKYVNKVAKRTGGFEVWSREQWFEKINEINLSEIWGVGRSHQKSFTELGFRSVSDFLAKPQQFIKETFGIGGEHIYLELKGVAVFPVESNRKKPKSVMSSRSLQVPSCDYLLVENEIKNHVFEVVKELNHMNLKASILNVFAYPSRYGDFIMMGFNQNVSFDLATNDLFLLTKEAIVLLNKSYKKGVPYKRIGVVVSGIRSEEIQTSLLFGNFEKQDTKHLSNLIFNINTKHKQNIIKLGVLIKNTKVDLVSKKHLSPAYTTKWTDIKTVKT